MTFERFPFDSNNLIGYLIAVLMEYIIYWYIFFIGACTLSLGIGAYLVAISVTQEIKRNLHDINVKTKANEYQSAKLKILLSQLIYTHAIVLKLSEFLSSEEKK